MPQDFDAGSGSYPSGVLMHAVEPSEYGGRSMISGKGRRQLRQKTRKVVGCLRCRYSIREFVSDVSVDRQVFGTCVREVEGLQFGLILGAACMRQHDSVLVFEEVEWSKPAPGSPRAPLFAMVHPPGRGAGPPRTRGG